MNAPESRFIPGVARATRAPDALPEGVRRRDCMPNGSVSTGRFFPRAIPMFVLGPLPETTNYIP
jgi:hypothetical protein